jgi:hypothetical protein
MIPVLIFYAHVVFLVYMFSKNYTEEGGVSAFLSILFIVIIFSVGWTFSEFLIGFFMKPEGLGLMFPRAAFSLMMLTVIEVVFYKFYYGSKRAARVTPDTLG